MIGAVARRGAAAQSQPAVSHACAARTPASFQSRPSLYRRDLAQHRPNGRTFPLSDAFGGRNFVPQQWRVIAPMLRPWAV